MTVFVSCLDWSSLGLYVLDQFFTNLWCECVSRNTCVNFWANVCLSLCLHIEGFKTPIDWLTISHSLTSEPSIVVMSNPFEDSEEEPNRLQDVSVKEGLLCPVCVSDFRTINELREHFETNHKNEFNSNTNQSKQIGSQLKGFLNKTKRILKNDSNVSLEETNDSMATNANISYVQHWRQQMSIGL